MELDLASIFGEVMITTIIKRKLENGEELSDKEKDIALQRIYKSVNGKIQQAKGINNTKSRLAFSTLSIVTSLMGKQGEGYHNATKAFKTNSAYNIDNYKRVLKGINITAGNQIPENFATLIAQYEASEEFSDAFVNFALAFREKHDSYKKDYASPIAPENVTTMAEKREEILELETRYRKK